MGGSIYGFLKILSQQLHTVLVSLHIGPGKIMFCHSAQVGISVAFFGKYAMFSYNCEYMR
jgi:hypothetical protein